MLLLQSLKDELLVVVNNSTYGERELYELSYELPKRNVMKI